MFTLLGQNEPKDNVDTVIKSTDITPLPTTSRGDRFYNIEQQTVISQDLLRFTNNVFSRSLFKDKWKELTTSCTQIKDTEYLLVAPAMEAEMKEELKRGTVTLQQRNSSPFIMVWLTVNLLF